MRGEVAERPNAPVLKTGGVSLLGSNPSLTAVPRTVTRSSVCASPFEGHG